MLTSKVPKNQKVGKNKIMNILLTGATGFLGNALAERFSEQGHQVYGIVRENSSPEKQRQLLQNGVKLLQNNLIGSCITESNIDCVVHTATNYGREGTDLSEILESNLVLPLQILKKIAEGNKNITFINTDSFFNKDNNIYSPLIDYSLSKKSLLEWLIYFSDLFPIINMRIEHIYGPNDGSEKFIPSITSKLVDTKTTEINLSLGLQVRDFIYISDVVDTYCIVIEDISKNIKNGFIEYQIGTGQATTIKELVIKMASISGTNSSLIFGALPYREKEIMSSVSNKNFQTKFNWTHKTTLEKGLTEVITKIISG